MSADRPSKSVYEGVRSFKDYISRVGSEGYAAGRKEIIVVKV